MGGGDGEGIARPTGEQSEAGRRAAAFVRMLSLEDRVLIDVRDQLYGGDWNEVEADLKARKEHKPHIFRLSTKIDEDLARIDALRAYEMAHGVDLGEVKRRLEAQSEAGAGAAAAAGENEEHKAGEGGGSGS